MSWYSFAEIRFELELLHEMKKGWRRIHCPSIKT
jgi:hypothetical protein